MPEPACCEELIMLPDHGTLLRIFIGEADRHDGKPVYDWLLHKAQEEGLAGATVIRGLQGFGASTRLHTAKVLRLSADLPVIVEIVDTEEKIENFLPLIDECVSEGLVTMEKVNIRIYRGRNE